MQPGSHVTAPALSPDAGTFPSAQTVRITCPTPFSAIYYTTDGSAPTTASTRYLIPVTVDTTRTLKAIAAASGIPGSPARWPPPPITLGRPVPRSPPPSS